MLWSTSKWDNKAKNKFVINGSKICILFLLWKIVWFVFVSCTLNLDRFQIYYNLVLSHFPLIIFWGEECALVFCTF